MSKKIGAAAVVGKDDQDWQRNMAFSVYVQDKETPVYTSRGRFLAVSPDGKYLIAQTGDTVSSVCDIDAGQIVGQFSVSSRDDAYAFMHADFSEDGTRLAVNTTQGIEIMNMTEGYPQWPMVPAGPDRFTWGCPHLSPDGTRVLCGGNGCASLFDTATGALLHTFEETERFVQPGRYGDGFWNVLTRTAEDWVGTVTDRFKSRGTVEAVFANDGARVVTHAAGQVIRVWDAVSGKLLHTIHTGLPERRNKNGWIDNRIEFSATARFAFCHNGNNLGTASLWSLDDGTLQRRYLLPPEQTSWLKAAPTDDGTGVYLVINGKLCRWPGVPVRGH